MNPTHAIAYHWYAEYLGAMKRFDEAIAIVKRALQLEPLSPVISLTLAGAYNQARRYDEAFEELQKIVAEIEDGEISVDMLSDKVKRAAMLIKICKSKLTATEEDVNNILKDLDGNAVKE